MVEGTVAAIGVVVPVHNEELLLGRCLSGLAAAAAVVPVPTRVVLVLDRCTDGSAAIAWSHARAGAQGDGGSATTVITSARPGVGAARAAGVREVLRRHPADGLWLATTDADSEVPPHWLARQLEHAGAGADLVVGTVAVADWSDHPPATRERFLADYRPVPGHRHMHGANLGFRAPAYLAVGGFGEHESDEDVDLIQRFEADGRCVVWAADVAVLTSARRVGRAPRGFADHLISLEDA